MTTFQIDESARLATADDHATIHALATTARSEAVDKRGGPLLVDRDLRATDAVADTHDLIVGTIDGVVVGYCSAIYETLRSGPPLAVVDEIYVLPDARGVGVGEAMLELVLARATERGCRGVTSRALPGDRDTKNFFETFGLVARVIEVYRPLAAATNDDGSETDG